MANTIALIVGSLREGAYTRLMGNAVKKLALPSMKFVDVSIGDLPFYNQDLETATPPAPWTRFRDQIKSSSAVLFVTPEYNRGMPGAVKNALDVGSRPWGHSVWNGKPTAVISLTPGALGGMAAHQQLRHTLSVLNSPTLPGPEAYIHSAAGLFDEAGQLKSAETGKLITGLLQAFEVWIKRFQG